MDGRFTEETEFWYGIYIMGISLGQIEPVEGASHTDWLNHLSDDARETIIEIRDGVQEIEDEDEMPEQINWFFNFARSVVVAEHQSDETHP
jgi:hypothetical protein